LNHRFPSILILALFAGAMSACTWVELTEQGKGVKVMSEAPSECKKLGATRSMTKSDIASIDRNREKVATELETLARNAAASMGGDTIVPETEISEQGEQSFGIYDCAS